MQQSFHPVWGYGFRPFFLFGALLAVILGGMWGGQFYSGNFPVGHFDSISWHAHEMIFGFAVALFAGFLMTASSNWSGVKGPHGKSLTILFISWAIGRLALIIGPYLSPGPSWWFVLLDMIFWPLLVKSLWPMLMATKQMRNIQFLIIVSFLGLANLLMHFSAMELIDSYWSSKALYMALNLSLAIVMIIAGRIVPSFTANAIPGVKARQVEKVEKLIFFSIWAYVAVDFFFDSSRVIGVVAALVSVVHFIRWWGWCPWSTVKKPLLWILHLGYLWIIIGFVLVSLYGIFDFLPKSVAIHAFTAGAIGLFGVGMTSRVALGHTGRPLKLLKGFVFAYFFILMGAVVRIVAYFFDEYYQAGILLASSIWILGFFLFFIYYFPILTRPRFDGRPG